jgi:L-2-hydroxyglutarate oxidase LhgO
VLVIEKESQVGSHQTAHNSGVAHSGVYYVPGSLKARLTREGLALLRSFCSEHQLPWIERGKLIVAVSEGELPRLQELYRRGTANGLRDLDLLAAERLGEIEPEISGIAGLHVPEAAVLDYGAVARTLAQEVESAGGRILTRHRVTKITRESGGVRLDLAGAERSVRVSAVVACAGQQADRVALAGGETEVPRIVPFFGRYWDLDAKMAKRVRGLVYPVPDPRYPFLGVHFTRGVDEAVKVGPGAVVALGREAYDRHGVSLGETAEMVRSEAFRALARKHWRTGVDELSIMLSTAILARKARAYLSEIRGRDLRANGGGIRAQAVDRDGALLDDFEIRGGDRIFHVLNAPSPAATASFAIASELDRRLETAL